MKTRPCPFAFVLVLALLGGPAFTNARAAEARPAKEAKAEKSEKSGKKAGVPAAEDLFAQPKVYRFKIDLPAAARESLQKVPKQYVKASVSEGGKTCADVGVRLKGSGSFQTIDKKPGLALKFNEFVKNQELHGRSRFLLNNSTQDATYLSEAVGGELFRMAGVPAAKVAFARVEMNGRDLGLYVMTEAANHDFLSQHFKKSKGNLYEGSNNDVTDKLEKDGGDDSTDQGDVRALAQAVKEADPALRLKKLTPLLDMERFVAFAAVEVLIGHHDGYTMDRNNYRIYHDPATGQMVFIAHGLDQLFGKPDEPILPEWKGLVAKAVFSTPEGRKRYLDKLSELTATIFKTDTLRARINELAATIRPALAERDSAATKAFDESVAKLIERVASRIASVEQQLKAQAVK